MNEQHFSKIVELFQRSDALPQLPDSAIRLMELIDKGDPSPNDLERVIAPDPALAACLLRTASSVAYGSSASVTTLRAAALRLGLRAVRTIALTFAMQAVLGRKTQSELFDPVAFSRHSLFVGITARTLFQNTSPIERRLAGWSPEEVFAAGLLHDLSSCLLAQLAPDLFDRSWERARNQGYTLEDGFLEIFGVPLPMLGCAAVCAWKLPELFAEGIAFIAEPPQDLSRTLCRDCILYADGLSPTFGFGREPWSLPERRISSDLSLSQEDQMMLETECNDLLAFVPRAA